MVFRFKADHFCIAEKGRAQLLSMGNIFKGKFERIDCRVVHPVSSDYFAGEGRFLVSRFFRIERFTWNTALPTKVREIRGIGFVIAFNGHKQAARVFNAVGRDPFQYFILLVAFLRCPRVGGNVPATAVKQSVVSARGPRINISLFNQQNLHTAQCQISCETGACDPTSNDECLSVQPYTSIW